MPPAMTDTTGPNQHLTAGDRDKVSEGKKEQNPR